MSISHQKLELTWIGKNDSPKIEPRILIHQAEYSYGEKNASNMLIHGDNLLALKALEQQFANQIKCIYIDPPYNTGSAFEHYDDNLEHSTWLSLMKPRLELLKTLLRDDGSIWISIDNAECHYLKILCDEVFGRKNFVQMISVKRATPAGFKVINPGPLTVTDYVLLYAKNKNLLSYNPQRIPVDYDENYDLYITNPNESPQHWKLRKLTDLLYSQYGFDSWKDAKATWGTAWKLIRNNFLSELAISLKDSVVSVRDPHKPSDIIKKALIESKNNNGQVIVLERENKNPILVYQGGVLSFYREKLRFIENKWTPTEILTDFWDDLNFSGIAKEGNVQFKNSKKPEKMIQRILSLATNEGDLVLDSFLGSGTTCAVAHKMNRRWIGIELGDHCYSHCLPRLKQVVDGSDQSGISKVQNWKGGGGFKVYELAKSLLRKDKFGNWIINKEFYNPEQLAEAMAKHKQYQYQPDDECFWKQGVSYEKNYIFTTTQFLNGDYLDMIHQELAHDEYLLICCSQYDLELEHRYDNITIERIPESILTSSQCEFDKEHYNLNVKTDIQSENDDHDNA